MLGAGSRFRVARGKTRVIASGRTRAFAAGLAVFLVFVSAATAATYAPVVIRIGNIVVKATAGLTPANLPKTKPVPIKASIQGTVRSTDGSHVPPAEEISVDIDKNFTINAGGLPVCRPQAIEARSTANALKACRPALVGHGYAVAQVALPEQAPFTARGPLLFFNGGVSGKKTIMFVHLYASIPAPTAIVAKVVFTRINDGPYGTRATATVPKIAGGYGSVVGFGFSIGRRLSGSNGHRGYIEAACPGNRYLTKAAVKFTDGTRYRATIALPCRGNGSHHGGYYSRMVLRPR